MTWGEIQIISLQKMFLNNDPIEVKDLADLKVDSQYSNYFNSMPAVTNEALNRITTNYKHIIKRYALTTTVTDTEQYIRYNLKEKITDLYKFIKIIYEEDGDYTTLSDYHFEDNDTLILNSGYKGTVTIEYYAYPTKITNNTSDTYELDVSEDICVLIPFYIASELYKEDDLQLATIYRNQFESGILELRDNDTGDIPQFQNTKGWY